MFNRIYYLVEKIYLYNHSNFNLRIFNPLFNLIFYLIIKLITFSIGMF